MPFEFLREVITKEGMIFYRKMIKTQAKKDSIASEFEILEVLINYFVVKCPRMPMSTLSPLFPLVRDGKHHPLIKCIHAHLTFTSVKTSSGPLLCQTISSGYTNQSS